MLQAYSKKGETFFSGPAGSGILPGHPITPSGEGTIPSLVVWSKVKSDVHVIEADRFNKGPTCQRQRVMLCTPERNTRLYKKERDDLVIGLVGGGGIP